MEIKSPLSHIWQFMEDEVFEIPSTKLLFNQYKDSNAALDQPDAAAIRRANLKNYLRSFKQLAAVLLVGEAPGPRGCRFSGIPFTSEQQLCSGRLPFSGRQSSNHLGPYSEQTATIFWDALRDLESRILAWNCIPFHPHRYNKPLSIRAPSMSEIEAYLAILQKLIDCLKPKLLLAVGRKAERALMFSGVDHFYVRHPSRGGARQFRMAVGNYFKTFV